MLISFVTVLIGFDCVNLLCNVQCANWFICFTWFCDSLTLFCNWFIGYVTVLISSVTVLIGFVTVSIGSVTVLTNYVTVLIGCVPVLSCGVTVLIWSVTVLNWYVTVLIGSVTV